MSKTIRCRSTEILTATQWNGQFDHPAVFIDPWDAYSIDMGSYSRGIELGDWIIEVDGRIEDVVCDEHFRRDYEAVEGEG